MRIPLFHISLTSFLFSALIISATEKDTIGLTDLLAREPGLDGSGLRIALAEASTSSTIDQYQPSPAAAGQPNSKFSYFDSTSSYPTAGTYDAAKQSNHANNVANNYFDLNTGVATDVDEIYVFNAEQFINDIVSPQTNINANTTQTVTKPFLSMVSTMVTTQASHHLQHHTTALQ